MKTQTRLRFGDVGMAEPIYRPGGELFRIFMKGECEALAQVFGSGYCVSDGHGMLG